MSFTLRTIAALFSVFIYTCTSASENSKVTDLLTEQQLEYISKKGVIKVCIDPKWMPYEAISDEGKHIGMSADYFDLLSTKTGATFQLHPTQSWKDTLASAKNRQCDVIAMARATDERKAYLDFTSPYVSFPYVIATTTDKQFINDLDDNLDKSYGVINGYAVIDYLKSRYPDIKLVTLDNFDEGIKKLRTGEIFGYFDSLVTIGYYTSQKGLLDIKVGGETNFSSAVSVATRNDEPILQSIMQDALDSVEPEEARDIRNKWVNLNYAQQKAIEQKKVTLTDQERKFLKNNANITMCVDPDWMPYEAIIDGRHTGIGGNLLPIIAERAGVKLTLIESASWSQSLELFQAKECDVLSMVNQTPERDLFMDYTRPYFQGHIVFVADNTYPYIADPSEILGKQVAVVKGYSVTEFLKRDYQNIELIEVENYDTAFKMVASGEVDLAADYLISSGDRIQRLGLYNLKIAGNTPYINKLRVGIQKDQNELFSIFDKAVSTLQPQEVNAVINKWRTVRYQQAFNYTLLWQVLAAALIIILASLFWNWRLSAQKRNTQAALDELAKVQQKLEQLAVTDKLTQLFNRMKLDQVLQQELDRAVRYQTPFSLILIDIDHFKSINDEYGHQAGDSVLMSFADILMKSSRITDTIGRWGGEEFLIICSETTLEQAQQHAEKLRQKVAEKDFIHVGPRTASFGVTSYQQNDSLNDLMVRVDEALYSAKHQGRNSVVVKGQ
jgi:polar amino acid transport system substrate-binding protein